jgi:quinol monooxygenase YgiN
MSVVVTIRLTADPAKVEEFAARSPEVMKRVSEAGVAAGCTWHRFFGSDNEVLVIDEWPDAESFHSFFGSNAEIPGMMQDVGVTAPPEIKVWRYLDTKDDIG